VPPNCRTEWQRARRPPSRLVIGFQPSRALAGRSYYGFIQA
jgi:hypothetical protein